MKSCWKRGVAALMVVGASCGIFCSAARSASSGEEVYRAKCAMCHGPDGGGKTPMGQRLKMRDLRSPEVQKQTDEQLTAIIANGKASMPGYAKTMSPADIQQLVAYIRSIAAKS